ncbi:RNA 2',3'-cyclic phosphodiesterase [Halobacillus andaensis]|uniref:RNA 2',3'-cyclic phosphodiesterase n=1 Tax=Halobacillus andaensis TaxID=1176239 RepID=A0A917AYV1_HALAA|nr:RNA 2',3'-cyclic phosphodiesterase [Halobacillus andaensis]MBP2002795.1 2'-5' RNA ligase [Halobacillus andaensis]GGF05767.1 RNA 2',3'-cyclic phosphodiesterase [Halobacillus andaensis]
MSSHYFIGIPIKSSVREKCASWQQELLHSMSYKVWTNPNDLHITLKFLGACTKKQIDEWAAQLTKIEALYSFSLKIGPAGTFGDKKRPRVFFVKVERQPLLLEMKNRIEEIGELLGFPREKRDYSPHITLAKKWQDGESPLYKGTDDFNDEIALKIDRFHIYKIHPRSKPKYEIVATFNLKEDGRWRNL